MQRPFYAIPFYSKRTILSPVTYPFLVFLSPSSVLKNPKFSFLWKARTSWEQLYFHWCQWIGEIFDLWVGIFTKSLYIDEVFFSVLCSPSSVAQWHHILPVLQHMVFWLWRQKALSRGLPLCVYLGSVWLFHLLAFLNPFHPFSRISAFLFEPLLCFSHYPMT